MLKMANTNYATTKATSTREDFEVARNLLARVGGRKLDIDSIKIQPGFVEGRGMGGFIYIATSARFMHGLEEKDAATYYCNALQANGYINVRNVSFPTEGFYGFVMRKEATSK